MKIFRPQILGLLFINPVTSADDNAAYLLDLALSYPAYPPIDPDPSIWTEGAIKPIDVYVLQNILSINSISPGSSEFTATTRTSYFWTPENCNQTQAQKHACETTLDDGHGLKFFSSHKAKTLPERVLYLSQENIFSEKFEEDGKTDLSLNAEMVETRGTYAKSYDVRYFPWEVHSLEIPLTSLYTTNAVNVIKFPGNVESKVKPLVPNGWELLGTYCDLDTTSKSDKISNTLEFTTYMCRVAVSRTNGGWWWTSFLLFSSLILMAYAGTVGLTSHMVAECRDDRDSARKALYDGTRLVGTYTIGLLLTYVFQVQISPYGNSIEFWPSIPSSSMIYVLGLMGIIFQSFAGLAGSFIFSRPLIGDGFVGDLRCAYNLDKVPKEGKDGEDRAPLVLKKFNPDAKKASEESGDQQEGVVDSSIALVRKKNQKSYVVLSLEEAVYVNSFVKRLFLFKTALLVTIALCAFGILVAARVGYGNDRKKVYEFLAQKGI